MKDKRVIIILLVVSIILVGVTVGLMVTSDREGPVITVDASKVKPYSATQSLDVLKSYVNAVDAVDGDVSDSIMIENVYVMNDMTQAKVIYTARDKSNNISKIDYIVDYIPSSDETNKNETKNDEPETVNEKETKSDSSSQKNTETTAAEKKDGNENTTTKAVSSDVISPVLVLKSTEATIKKGDTFNISSYIDKITDDKESMADLSKRIIVQGTYNVNKTDDYDLSIYCTDKDMHSSNVVDFVLHVK